MKFLSLLLLCSTLIVEPSMNECWAQDDDDDAEIALLKEQMDMLAKKLDQLSKKRRAKKKAGNSPKKPIAATHPSGAAQPALKEAKMPVPPTQELPKPLVTSGNDRMSVKLSGQVNRLALWRTNGQKERVEHLDSNASSTRFNITGEGKATEDLKVQGVIEVELQDFNPSNTTKIAAASEGGGTGSLRPRRLEALFISQKLGSLFVGQGSMAADGTSEVDYSGTVVASNGSEGPYNLGGVQFYNNSTHSEDRRIASDAYNNFDGLSRANRIRYDTPEFLGFILGGSHSNRDQIDGALKFAGRFGETKVGAATGYSYAPYLKSGSNRRHNRQFNGSFSVLFPGGLSVGAAGGIRKFTHNLQDNHGVRRRNADFWFTKLGYQFNCFAMGNTALAVDLSRSRRHTMTETDFAVANSERMWSYAFTGVQTIDKIATELYTIFRVYELHRRKESFKKAYVAAVGARVKF
jgi:hypothetical protein